MKNKYILLIIVIFVSLSLFVYFLKQNSVDTKTSLENNSKYTQKEPINKNNLNNSGAIEIIKNFFIDEKIEKIPEISIDKMTANHIKANIFYNPGGSYLLASKINGQWVKVLEGNGFPDCGKIKQYNFPEDIVPSCLNELGLIVKNQWDSIKNSITNCEVKSIMQAHSLYVSAELKTGETLEGYEPNIDDIIKISVESENKCGKIIMATE